MAVENNTTEILKGQRASQSSHLARISEGDDTGQIVCDRPQSSKGSSKPDLNKTSRMVNMKKAKTTFLPVDPKESQDR